MEQIREEQLIETQNSPKARGLIESVSNPRTLRTKEPFSLEDFQKSAQFLSAEKFVNDIQQSWTQPKQMSYDFLLSSKEEPIWRQSVSTWRNGAPSHRFPKSKRFQEPRNSSSSSNHRAQSETEINLKSTLKSRNIHQGSAANKTDIFPFKHLEKGNSMPGPADFKIPRFLEGQNHYKIQYSPINSTSKSFFKGQSGLITSKVTPENNTTTIINNNNNNYKKNYNDNRCGRHKRSSSTNSDFFVLAEGVEPGKSFGLSYEYYRRNYLGFAKTDVYSPIFTENNPAVNSYDVSKSIGTSKPAISICPRRKMFNEMYDHSVPPLTRYSPNPKSITPLRYQSPSFGSGNKINIAAPLNDNPGPQYEIKSQFDRPSSSVSESNRTRSVSRTRK